MNNYESFNLKALQVRHTLQLLVDEIYHSKHHDGEHRQFVDGKPGAEREAEGREEHENQSRPHHCHLLREIAKVTIEKDLNLAELDAQKKRMERAILTIAEMDANVTALKEEIRKQKTINDRNMLSQSLLKRAEDRANQNSDRTQQLHDLLQSTFQRSSEISTCTRSELLKLKNEYAIAVQTLEAQSKRMSTFEVEIQEKRALEIELRGEIDNLRALTYRSQGELSAAATREKLLSSKNEKLIEEIESQRSQLQLLKKSSFYQENEISDLNNSKLSAVQLMKHYNSEIVELKRKIDEQEEQLRDQERKIQNLLVKQNENKITKKTSTADISHSQAPVANDETNNETGVYQECVCGDTTTESKPSDSLMQSLSFMENEDSHANSTRKRGRSEGGAVEDGIVIQNGGECGTEDIHSSEMSFTSEMCPHCSEASYGLMSTCHRCRREYHAACARIIRQNQSSTSASSMFLCTSCHAK